MARQGFQTERFFQLPVPVSLSLQCHGLNVPPASTHNTDTHTSTHHPWVNSVPRGKGLPLPDHVPKESHSISNRNT